MNQITFQNRLTLTNTSTHDFEQRKESLAVIQNLITNYWDSQAEGEAFSRKSTIVDEEAKVLEISGSNFYNKKLNSYVKNPDTYSDGFLYTYFEEKPTPSFHPNAFFDLLTPRGERSLAEKQPPPGVFRSRAPGFFPALPGDIFDDFFKDFKGKKPFSEFRLAEIKIFHDENAVFGLQVGYINNGNLIYAPLHLGRNAKGGCKVTGIVIDTDEKVTKIRGRSSDWIDRIVIETSKGKIIEAGGIKGQSFESLLPPNHMLIAFGGYCREYLHAFYIYYQPL